MTISDAFQRFPPKLLRQALSRLIAEIERPVVPELALIGDIDAVDGSVFPVMGGMTYVRESDTPSVKLHLDFKLSTLLAINFVIGASTSSERQAFRTMLTAGTTYVLDRGYMAFAIMRDAVAAQAHVIMRAYSNIVVETIAELGVTIPSQLTQQWTHIRDRQVRSFHEDAEGLEFRLVEFTVGATDYKLLTDRFDLSTFQVILIYAYRWQIELVFRFFKHTMQGLHVISQSHWGIENYFAGMFLTALLHLQFKTECLEVDGYTARPTTDTAPTNEAVSDDSRLSARVDPQVQPSRDETRPSANSTVARFLARLNQPLGLFWKIPKHWLTTLADYLHRQFTPDVIKLLNKRALANVKPT